MNLYLKIILIIFGLAYLISPVDIIPDLLLPYFGWIDDTLVLGTIFYLIRYGKLPDFLFKKQGLFNPNRFNQGRSRQDRPRQAFGPKPAGSGPGSTPGSGFNPQQGSSSDPVKSPYEILGIEPSASKKQIQAAYKTAIKKYHPDKLSHLGEEFSNLANKKFLEIQTAYDTLMKP